MTPLIGRRTILQGMAAGVAAIAVGAVGAPGAYAAPGSSAAPGFWHAPTRLNRQDKVFLERGLMHGAWVRSGSADGWIPSAKLWNGAGFTTPQFYREHLAASATNTLSYSDELVRGRKTSGWAVARAPFGGHINPDFATYPGTGFPDPSADWLTPEMRRHVSELHTACFGDEEAYSTDRLEYFRQAYEAMHARYPWVLVHNNQSLGLYNDAQLAEYTRVAKPDLLTWDWYPWQRNQIHAGGRPNPLLQHIERYRRVALAGHDGTGADPLTFGQYTTGFRLQPERPADDTANLTRFKRRVNLSESQLNLAPYITWAAGGKWLSLFRWELTDEYTDPVTGNTWETDGLFLTDGQENPYPAYYRYAGINTAMRALSPYLTRLRSQAIGRIAGRAANGAPLSSLAGIPEWSASIDTGSGLVGASSVNVGTGNGGNPGDLFIGTFREIPGLSAGENRGVLPDRAATRAFMVVNAMAYQLTDYTDPHSAGGTGADLRQRVTVIVDPSSVDGSRERQLYRIDRITGRPVGVPLTRSAGSVSFEVDLDGGAGELFVWG